MIQVSRTGQRKLKFWIMLHSLFTTYVSLSTRNVITPSFWQRVVTLQSDDVSRNILSIRDNIFKLQYWSRYNTESIPTLHTLENRVKNLCVPTFTIHNLLFASSDTMTRLL